MSNRIVAYSAALAASAFIAVAGSSVAFAAEPAQSGAVYGAKTVGAMYFEARDVATVGGDVRGAATAATVRWTAAPSELQTNAGSAYGYGSVGAMVRESAGVATSGAAVALQGGGATASAVRWTAGS